MKLPMNSNQRRYESIFQQKKAQHETQAQMKELIKNGLTKASVALRHNLIYGRAVGICAQNSDTKI